MSEWVLRLFIFTFQGQNSSNRDEVNKWRRHMVSSCMVAQKGEGEGRTVWNQTGCVSGRIFARLCQFIVLMEFSVFRVGVQDTFTQSPAWNFTISVTALRQHCCHLRLWKPEMIFIFFLFVLLSNQQCETWMFKSPSYHKQQIATLHWWHVCVFVEHPVG